jgi:anti-sigma regulatory factor (Ser/Thr protein kinase)
MGCSGIFEELDLRGAAQASAWHLELNPEPRSAGAARRFVLGCLGALDDETAGTLELLTSELVTNAILHARTPLVLGVARSGDRIVVCVEDRDLVRPEQQPYSDDRIDGRGIVILEALADRWGIATHERGKAVWFTMRLTADSAEGATR